MGEGQTSKRKRSMETPSNPKVKLCFESQDGCKYYYKVDRNINIQKLLQAYCEEKQIEYGTAIFLHDGKRLRRRGTVDQVGLVDEAQIDVMIYQSGGGPSKFVM